mgnify:CR=1 FL=1
MFPSSSARTITLLWIIVADIDAGTDSCHAFFTVYFLKDQKEQYVVMADTNIATTFDFKAMINEHVKSGADVSMV